MPSGRVRISSYPRAAQTIASAIPVLPLVGSTTTARPGLISPSSSAASIIATPIRSLTEPPGLKYSSLAQTCAPSPSAMRSSSTIGVPPTTADASAPTLTAPALLVRCSSPNSKSGAAKKRVTGYHGSRSKGAEVAEFKQGDRVTWKSHGGEAIGRVEKKITSETEAGGRKVVASKNEPQYLVKSEKSGGEAVHKPEALKPAS